MTTNFIKRISLLATTVFDDRPYRNVEKGEVLCRLLISTSIMSLHCAYALSTEKSELVNVVNKYKMNINGYTEFMIIDDKGRHFNVNNSLWYWKWNSIEDWHKIEPNKELFIQYYGWRWPIFGLFPNIVMSNNEQFLNPIIDKKKYIFENTKIAKFKLIH